MVLIIFLKSLIPHVILNAIHGKPLPIYGDGSQIRDWLYVEDHAKHLLRSLLKAKLVRPIILVATMKKLILR